MCPSGGHAKKKGGILAETLTKKYLEGRAHTEQRIWLWNGSNITSVDDRYSSCN